MKKFCKAIIFLIILAAINSQSSNCEEQDPTSEKSCWSKTTKEEREIGTYCCYAKLKEDDGKYSSECVKLTKEEIDSVKAKLKEFEKAGDTSQKLVCDNTSESDSDSNSDSYYIQIKILLFVLVLL